MRSLSCPVGGTSPCSSDPRVLRHVNDAQSHRHPVVSPLQGQTVGLRCLQPLSRSESRWGRGGGRRHGMYVLPSELTADNAEGLHLLSCVAAQWLCLSQQGV